MEVEVSVLLRIVFREELVDINLVECDCILKFLDCLFRILRILFELIRIVSLVACVCVFPKIFAEVTESYDSFLVLVEFLKGGTYFIRLNCWIDLLQEFTEFFQVESRVG